MTVWMPQICLGVNSFSRNAMLQNRLSAADNSTAGDASTGNEQQCHMKFTHIYTTHYTELGVF